MGGNERNLLGKDRDPVPTSEVFVRNVVELFLALYCVFKCMEPLSFDSPVKKIFFYSCESEICLRLSSFERKKVVGWTTSDVVVTLYIGNIRGDMVPHGPQAA